MNREKLERLAEALETGEYPETRGALCEMVDGEVCYCAQGVALLLDGFSAFQGSPAAWMMTRGPDMAFGEADQLVSISYEIPTVAAHRIRHENDLFDGHRAAARYIRKLLEES